MSDQLKMHSPNLVDSNIEKIAALFPNCVTEAQGENGELKKAIDFDLLKQELSQVLVEGEQERYRLDWVGKKESILTANAPIAKTLRPCREESVNFDTTENLFIEGDNLEALKLLQENYLGKVKMIYIDPPYNTGNDFIYEDDFAESTDEFFERSNQVDEEGNRLIANTDTNGRFHSDWLSMIYSRLKLARNILKDDGILFVSINDKEYENLKKLLDEVFGARNYVSTLIWDKNHSAQAGVFKVYHEYVVVFAKNIEFIDTPTSTSAGEYFEAGAMKRESARHPSTEFKFPKGTEFRAPDGVELNGQWGGIETVELISGRMIARDNKLVEDVVLKAYTQKNQMQQFFYGDRESLRDSRGQKIVNFYFNGSGKIKIVKERSVETPQTTLNSYGSQGVISTELANLFKLSQTPLDNPKSVDMIKDFIHWFTTNSNDIVVDFFAGSATTAHAVMKLNAEDHGKRQFIMVQLPQLINEQSEPYQAGYNTIAEISKERIRRAGKKIVEDNADKEDIENLDVGFRVLKIDSTNMKDVYYTPDAYKQADILDLADHIKEDRTSEDLLFQVMLDWGLELSLAIERKTIQGKEVFYVAGNSLVACFEEINFAMVDEIAQDKPLRVVSAERAIQLDHDKTNIKERFKQLSPETEVKFI